MNQEIKRTLEIMNQRVKEMTAIYHHAVSQYGISDNEFWVWYAL
ncbi:MAG: hypothetical protein E6124_05105 [Blautia producta]|nr:hypothetical protein [Blautia coccoides]MDU5381556.1 hypothetical protein [Blautia producta]